MLKVKLDNFLKIRCRTIRWTNLKQWKNTNIIAKFHALLIYRQKGVKASLEKQSERLKIRQSTKVYQTKKFYQPKY